MLVMGTSAGGSKDFGMTGPDAVRAWSVMKVVLPLRTFRCIWLLQAVLY